MDFKSQKQSKDVKYACKKKNKAPTSEKIQEKKFQE